jgi:hypothetical protein
MLYVTNFLSLLGVSMTKLKIIIYFITIISKEVQTHILSGGRRGRDGIEVNTCDKVEDYQIIY